VYVSGGGSWDFFVKVHVSVTEAAEGVKEVEEGAEEMSQQAEPTTGS